jgi:hypothetical protein
LSRDAIDGGLAVVVQVGVERVIHFETDLVLILGQSGLEVNSFFCQERFTGRPAFLRRRTAVARR